MRRGVALLLGDLVLAVLLFWPAWAHPASVTIGRKTDAPVTVWAFAWAARALSHGQSPWVTHAMAYPHGVNLMTNAGATGLGLLLAPVTWVWGPLASFNVAATASLALTAWSAQMVIRRAGLASWPAAIAGGLIAGFGPMALSQVEGAHLHMTAAFLLPPMLLAVGRLASGTGSAWRWGPVLGGLAAVQLLIGEEVLAIAAVTGFVGVVVAFASVGINPAVLLRGLLVAAGAFAALAAVPLWIQFFGPAHISGSIQPGLHYSNDLYGTLVPTGPVAIHGFAATAGRFTSEGGAYLGIPLVLIIVVAALRGSAVVRVIGVTALVTWVFSLGSPLVVGGHRWGLWLPWAVFGHLPLLESLLPVRFGVALDLLSGALLAVAIDDVIRWGWARWAPRGRHYRGTPIGAAAVIGAVAVAFVGLLPGMPRIPFRASRWAVPRAFQSPSLTGIPADEAVVTGPYAAESHPEVEVWFAVAGARWRSSGGNYVVPDAHGHVTIGGVAPLGDVVETSIENGSPVPYPPAMVRDTLRRDGFGGVLISAVAHRAESIAFWTSVLGPPSYVDNVAVFRVGS